MSDYKETEWHKIVAEAELNINGDCPLIEDEGIFWANARIAELELHLKQTLDNSISQASALRDRISELEAELSFYANCSYSSSWATGDKNHVMEDRGDRASNYLFGKAEPRKSCNTAIEALKEQGNG